MKKIKFVIILLCLVALMICLFLLVHKNMPKNKDYIVEVKNIVVPNTIHSIGYKDFFTVSNCISQYLDILNKKNSSYYGKDKNGQSTLIVTSKQVADNILGLISENYKNELDIDNSNIASKIKMLNEKNILTIIEVNKIREGNVTSYVAKGFTTNIDNVFLREVVFIVNLDAINHTFSIEELNSEVDLDNIERESIEKIEKNDYNSYKEYTINEEDIINKHMVAFKRMILAKPELAYEYLDEQYRNKRFGSYEKFQDYIENFRDDITKLNMKNYKVNSYDEYKEFIVTDANGNYYRFCERNVMDYSVMLDVYTIDLPEYLEKFNNGDEKIKVGLCIERFLQMVNARDYEAAYNLLDDTFRKNNFKTLEEYKKYIQDNFNFSNNLKAIDYFSKEGLYYICKVSIENAKFPQNELIQRSFIIKIEEGTSFKMSIDLE